MAREYPSTMSQDRALRLFGLTADGTDTGAQAVLTAAGLSSNGIPIGMTPHAAKKLADDELKARLFVTVGSSADDDVDATDYEAAGRFAARPGSAVTVEAAAPREIDAEAASAAGATAAQLARAERAARTPDLSYGTYLRRQKARARQNSALRAAGYRWSKEHEDNDPDPEWTLVAPDGRVVTVAEALAEIEQGASRP